MHFVWATWERAPLITPEIERRLYRNSTSEVQKMKCKVLTLNGMPDHVHLVAKIPTTITIANLMRQVKGVSPHFVNEMLRPETHFKWQGSYGAFTVSRWDLDKIIAYVKRQKEHHQLGNLYPEWEAAFEEFASESDE